MLEYRVLATPVRSGREKQVHISDNEKHADDVYWIYKESQFLGGYINVRKETREVSEWVTIS